MAQRPDVARAQEILDRWCALAEQRLDHLTELFETGRWRRYHSEVSFLENIQEAKIRGRDLAQACDPRSVAGQFGRRHLLAEQPEAGAAALQSAVGLLCPAAQARRGS